MVHILHISDLHFVSNAASYNFQSILLKEACEKVMNIPQGEKLLIATGDFHNFWDNDYKNAEQFLKDLASGMGLDMKEDVFVVPGNHDVGNDDALNKLLKRGDKNWKRHHKAYLYMLKNGNMEYIEDRVMVFRPYSAFVQGLGVYETTMGDDYPASAHVRNWRGKLNILHLNTALIAEGRPERNEMSDVDKASAPDTWLPHYNEKNPSLAIGHNSYYDLKDNQRHDLAGTFALRNVSAYLSGDKHQIERDPEHQMIRIEAGYRGGWSIPNLVAAKSIADGADNESEIGFCWHQWDENSDKVTVEFRKWTRNTLGKTISAGEDGVYKMRR